MKQVLLFLMVFCAVNGRGQIITTFAGGGTSGIGDGGPATSAIIPNPNSGIFDKYGNFYFINCISGNRVRKVDTLGIISTVAGTGIGGYFGDGGQATSAKLNGPISVRIDGEGNIYISDVQNFRIRKVDKASGIITTYVGNGVGGYNGDGIPATSASIYGTSEMAMDKFGNLYIADYYNQRVRKINTLGIITTYAGTGVAGSLGDGGAATNAQLNYPVGLTIDSFGNIFVGESTGARVRKIDAMGNISTIAGNGLTTFTIDGIPATNASIVPIRLAIDSFGKLYIGDNGNNRVYMIDNIGIIHTVAGTGVRGATGDNGPATACELDYPSGIALDACGNLYICEADNRKVRKVTFDTSCNPHGYHGSLNVINLSLELSISPNPVSTTLSVSYTNQFYDVSIYNLINQTLFTQAYTSTKAEIDMSGYPAGVYIVRVRDKDGGQIVRKVVKE